MRLLGAPLDSFRLLFVSLLSILRFAQLFNTSMRATRNKRQGGLGGASLGLSFTLMGQYTVELDF